MMRRGKEHGIKPAMAKEASNHILATQGPLPNRGTFPERLTEEIPALGKPQAGYGCPECKVYVAVVEKHSHETLND